MALHEKEKLSGLPAQPGLEASETRKNFFSQLRRLGRDLESGIDDLKRDLDTNNSTCSANSAVAMNMVLHTTKELRDLKSKACAEKEDFITQSAKVSNIQDLIKSVFQTHAERLEKVESFIEQYGYIRPQIGISEEEKKNTPENKLPARDDVESEPEDDNCGTRTDGGVEGADAKTPPNDKGYPLKAREQNLLRTPKFEDMCSNLSETTLAIFQQKKRGQEPVTREPQIATGVSVLESPEVPTLRTMVLTPGCQLADAGKHLATPKINDENSSSPTVPNLARPAHMLTPETPKCVRNIMESNKKTKPGATHHDQSEQGNYSVLSTPNINTCSENTSPPTVPNLVRPAHMLTPETPKCVRNIMESAKKTKLGATHHDQSAQGNYSVGDTQANHCFSAIPSIAKLHLSTPETPECVTLVLNSIKKAE